MILAKPANPDFAEHIRLSFASQAIMKLIGAELGRVEPGFVEITLPYRSDLTQQHGYLHAGILTTIADSACGYAAFSLMPQDSEVLSVEFKMNLLSPAKGKSFLAKAAVIKSGKTLTVVRGDVFSVSEKDEQHLVATMQGTMICMRGTKAKGDDAVERNQNRAG
ncbi:MAG TPA: PaaI family thioesterase [Pyrinomonadaceae bacterium]|nr:PaaI family thioesterase [Pyrinomonadaceae bacterium]